MIQDITGPDELRELAVALIMKQDLQLFLTDFSGKSDLEPLGYNMPQSHA